MGFCAVSDVATKLQLTIAADNASALAAIEEASAVIQGYCHQTIEAVEDEEITLDIGERQTKIFLPELPVTEISAVEEDGEGLVVDTDYKLGQHGILHRVNAYWTAGVQKVTVTYSHGYATIPQAVVDVCAALAGRRYQAGLQVAAVEGQSGVRAYTLGDYSVQYETSAGGQAGTTGGAVAVLALTDGEKAALARYRHKGA